MSILIFVCKAVFRPRGRNPCLKWGGYHVKKTASYGKAQKRYAQEGPPARQGHAARAQAPVVGARHARRPAAARRPRLRAAHVLFAGRKLQVEPRAHAHQPRAGRIRAAGGHARHRRRAHLAAGGGRAARGLRECLQRQPHPCRNRPPRPLRPPPAREEAHAGGRHPHARCREHRRGTAARPQIRPRLLGGLRPTPAHHRPRRLPGVRHHAAPRQQGHPPRGQQRLRQAPAAAGQGRVGSDARQRQAQHQCADARQLHAQGRDPELRRQGRLALAGAAHALAGRAHRQRPLRKGQQALVGGPAREPRRHGAPAEEGLEEAPHGQTLRPHGHRGRRQGAPAGGGHGLPAGRPARGAAHPLRTHD